MLALSRLPHARGGVSERQPNGCFAIPSSPRPWGCFLILRVRFLAVEVFPTPVGVFLSPLKDMAVEASLPHARGGVSMNIHVRHLHFESSPRPWGCFLKNRRLSRRKCVFPTPVGVFLIRRAVRFLSFRLPHARGGVSLRFHRRLPGPPSSPRPWGCFFSV